MTEDRLYRPLMATTRFDEAKLEEARFAVVNAYTAWGIAACVDNYDLTQRYTMYILDRELGRRLGIQGGNTSPIEMQAAAEGFASTCDLIRRQYHLSDDELIFILAGELQNLTKSQIETDDQGHFSDRPHYAYWRTWH